MSAPAWASSGTYFGASTASAAIAVPAGVSANDIIVIPIFLDDSTRTITGMPSGFSHAPNSPVLNSGGGGSSHSLNLVWKRATGSDSGTYTFTISSSAFVSGAAQRYTGATTTGTPFDTASGGDTPSASNITNSATTPPVSITTLGPDRLLLFEGTNWGGGAWTPPTTGGTWSERLDTGDEVNTIDDKAQAVAGSSGSVTATCATSDKTCGWIGALIGTTVTIASAWWRA